MIKSIKCANKKKHWRHSYHNLRVCLKEKVIYGMKVQYNYKLQDGTFELRTGYVAFMKNSSLYNANGVPKKSYAKFEFVGTNNNGEITTYHLESGKTFWKMMNNGENIPVIHPIE